MPVMKKIIVEKRVRLFSADTLAALSDLGVKIEGGSGRVYVELLVEPAREKDALRLARAEGYLLAGESRGRSENLMSGADEE